MNFSIPVKLFASALLLVLPGLPQGAGGAGIIPLNLPGTDRLILMREEEKFAGDVYRFLTQKWNLRILSNIAKSEDQHFRQIGTLLQRYGIPDPSAGKGQGEFQNPGLQALYTELTTRGSLSLKDALSVGTQIEGLDIADLEIALTETGHADVKRVYANLLNASFQHLDAFQASLELLPQY